MTAPLYAIGRFCSRHHYPVIAVWVVLAIALVAIGQASGSKTSENLTLPGTDSTRATELLEDNLPEQAYGSNPLTLTAPAGKKLTEAKYAAAVEETVKRLEALPDVNSAASPLTKGSQTLSKDQQIGYIPVVLGVGPGEIDEADAEQILNASQPARAAPRAPYWGSPTPWPNPRPPKTKTVRGGATGTGATAGVPAGRSSAGRTASHHPPATSTSPTR